MNDQHTTEQSNEPPRGRLLTTQELAEYLQASPRHVHNLRRRRQIPVTKIGRLTRYDLDKVKAALTKMTINARDY
jgi:excisionase family DNA binding protein